MANAMNEGLYENDNLTPEVREKLRNMLDDARAWPSDEDLLSDQEIQSLPDNVLLEQFTLAKFYSDSDYQSMAEDFWSDEMSGSLYEWTDSEGAPTEQKYEAYKAYYDTILKECQSRGYSEDQLLVDAQKNIDNAMNANLESLHGVGLNIHMLGAVNDTDEKLLYKYLTLSPFERETTTRFKSELEGPTKGVEAGSRWDESGATMNEGTEYSVNISKNEDGTYHCESPYLGDFDYDPKVFAIGYKEVPGEENLKLPVLRCLPDAPYTDNMKAFSNNYDVGMGLSTFDTSMMEGSRQRPDGMGLQEVAIPEGVKNIDYTFEDIDNLNFIPRLPDSLESAHCAFKGCDKLWQESETALDRPTVDFGDHALFHWPAYLEDMSGMFADCPQLHDLKFGDFPNETMTIENMFGGCTELFRGAPEHWYNILPGSNHTDGIMAGTFLSSTNKINWSDCPYLQEEFAYCIDKGTSNEFKAVAEREEKERQEFQMEFSKPENLAEQSQEVQDKHEDSVAANAAVRTEKVLRGDVTVRSLDEVSFQMPEENKWASLMQRGVIDLASFAVLKGVTGKVTGSNLAGWVVGIGGTAAGRALNILPRSFEPALQFVRQFLPESAQSKLDKFIKFIHVPGKEEMEAAKADQMDRYRELALGDSIGRSAWSADIFYNDNVVKNALRNNGKAVAESGVLQDVGEDGRESCSIVTSTIDVSISQAEQVFDKKMTAQKAGNGDGYDWNDEMRRYYFQMLNGLEGYSDGAKQGIVEHYGSAEAKLDKNNALNMVYAQEGLAYVNCDYASRVMESLKKMDNQYHFMEMEDWVKLDSLNIYGIESLSDYQPGKQLNPVGVHYNVPFTASDYSATYTGTSYVANGSKRLEGAESAYTPKEEAKAPSEVMKDDAEVQQEPVMDDAEAAMAALEAEDAKHTSRVQQAQSLQDRSVTLPDEQEDDLSYGGHGASNSF